MKKYQLISIVVPILNERATLRELYERTHKTIGEEQPFEFIVVDDGSTDDSYGLLMEMRRDHPNIRVIRHALSYGKSLALMQGFDMAQGEVAITMDGDLQEPPEAIPALLDMLEKGFDLVNGWRAKRKDSPVRRTISGVFNALTRRLFHCPLHDINCGFKAMSREVYQSLELTGDLHRLIPIIVVSHGHRVAEVRVDHYDRRHGVSRYHLLRYRGILDIISLTARQTTRWRPFHVFVEMAMLFWLLAFGCLIGWWMLDAWVPVGIWWRRLCSFLLAAIGFWAVFVGTLMPFFGFLMDVIPQQSQSKRWRESLIEKRMGLNP